MDLAAQFLKLVSYPTTSDEESATCPSTPGQLTLAKAIVEDMKAMGIADAHVDDHGYVYGTVPATAKAPTIGLIAHMDTSPDAKGEDIRARITEPYEGGDVILNEAQDIRLSPKEYPVLENHLGKHLIVTDGTTLLGADDKAGVAAILACADALLHSDKPHGAVRIGFTPDEEVGRGADLFDVKGFGADYAYTVDGGALGEIEYENFNAASALVEITGVSVHPGSAKDAMENALLLAMEVNAQLPAGEIPARTEGYEGFFHLDEMSGSVAEARMVYIIRDHDKERFQARKARMEAAVAAVQAAHPKARLTLTMRDSYYNMAEKLAECMHLIENAKTAVRQAGLEPETPPVRGGTDGARLSYMGLPCPNLGTGGYNYHGPYEFITSEGMDAVVEILKNLVALYRDFRG